MQLDYGFAHPLMPKSAFYQVDGAIPQGVAVFTPIFSVAVPLNSMVFFNARVKVSCILAEELSVTIDPGTDVYTAAGHGLLSGQGVFVEGTTQPGGVDAAATYYAGVIDADTFRIYDTQANASKGGSQGVIDATSAGSGVTVTERAPTAVDQGLYLIKGVVRNRRDGMSVLGPADIVPFSDVASIEVNVLKDEGAGLAQIAIKPDGTRETRYQALIQVSQEASAT